MYLLDHEGMSLKSVMRNCLKMVLEDFRKCEKRSFLKYLYYSNCFPIKEVDFHFRKLYGEGITKLSKFYPFLFFRLVFHGHRIPWLSLYCIHVSQKMNSISINVLQKSFFSVLTFLLYSPWWELPFAADFLFSLE